MLAHTEKKSDRRNRSPKGSFRGDERGTLIAPWAIMMPILFGIAGLGIDISNWHDSKRQAQAAADAAARAGALALVRNGSEVMILQAALNDAVAYGFSSRSIDINMPPISGNYLGDDSAVEVVVEYHPDSFFSKALLDLDVTVEARAAAKVVSSDTCIRALEENGPGFEIVGTADIEFDRGTQVSSVYQAVFGQVGSCGNGDTPRRYVEAAASLPYEMMTPIQGVGESMMLAETVSMGME
ncbi:MAG: pilus assembly protein TadG-related protein [Geminicoccaceae bacterium]